MITADLRTGKKNCRVEAQVEAGLDAGISQVAQELAGEGNDSRMFRSEAIRVLIAEGIVARRSRA